MPPLIFPFLFLLLIVLCHNGALHSIAAAAAPPGSLRLDLFRRPTPPLASSARLDHIRALVRDDLLRQRMIADRIARRRGRHHDRRSTCEDPSANSSLSSPPPSFEMPLNSGAYAGAGQYFVRFLLGTPAQRFVLLTDTGSDLTWVKCRLRRPGCQHCGGGGGGGRRVFRPEESRTFAPIFCSSDMCKTTLPSSLVSCPTPTSSCAYDYGYNDGSTAKGYYANESATVRLSDGRRAKLTGLVVGCTLKSDGTAFRNADGVLGLGYSDASFAKRATALFGGRFSYCLVDHLAPRNASSYLTFGESPDIARSLSSSAAPLSTTGLVLDSRIDTLYGVRVEALSVDGEIVPVPQSVWDVATGGGTILDSGSTLSFLTEPAYRPLMAALTRRLKGVPRIDEGPPFEYCYNWTSGRAPREEALPKLVVHLAGGAKLEPPAKSYVIAVADGVRCIGFTSATWPGVSTIGNIMQQEHVWEFDVKNLRVRFRKSKCRDGGR